MSRVLQVLIGIVLLLLAATIAYNAATPNLQHYLVRLALAFLLGLLGFTCTFAWGRPYTTRISLSVLSLALLGFSVVILCSDKPDFGPAFGGLMMSFIAGSSALASFARDGSTSSNAFGVQSARQTASKRRVDYAIGGCATVLIGGTAFFLSSNWPVVYARLVAYSPWAWRETSESDVDELPPKPVYVASVPAALMPASREGRLERMVKYNRRSLGAAYELVGHTNSAWDFHAHTALELAALHFSNEHDPHARLEDIRVATQKALDAGCDDPLIFYVHARSAPPGTLDAMLNLAYAKAARAMESSSYPPMRRAMAQWKAAERQLKKASTPETRAEAVRLIGMTLQLLSLSAREEKRCLDLEAFWYDRAQDCLAAYRKLGYEPHEAWRSIDDSLRAEPALEPTRLVIKGSFFIDWAWEARGSGYNYTVTSDGWRKFRERLSTARMALEQSSHGRAASFLLKVELGQPSGRSEREKRFEQALDYEPTHRICMQKLEWLHPRWHGSIDEMLSFGRACLNSENWDCDYPRVLAEVHQRIADLLPSETERAAYFERPDVAQDILYVYAKTVQRFPDHAPTRSRYAFYSYLCGHPRRAHRQFELLSDKLWWGGAFTEKMMKDARAGAAKQSR